MIFTFNKDSTPHGKGVSCVPAGPESELVNFSKIEANYVRRKTSYVSVYIH